MMLLYGKVYNIFICTLVLLNLFISDVWCRERKEKCQTCKNIVSAFYKGLEKTAKANFGGGNTAWEERALGTYARSETRLVEIMEQLCESSESECHAMVEEHEETMEEWWFKDYNSTAKENDFKQWLCIDTMKACCPNGTFGPDCKECPGGKDKPCSGRGDCGGDGTRQGDGKCSCNSGYDGDDCNDCADNFFDDESEDSKLKCTACHESCASGCSGVNAADCVDCKPDGWVTTEGEGCKDKNECEEPDKCEEGKYCVNTEGSFKCEDCHRSCEGNCTGEGPKGCQACKVGYTMSDNEGCKDANECDEGDKCEEGKFCLNTEGSYNCEGCHESCDGSCTGEGSRGCKSCKEGFHMTDDEGCKDNDECQADSDTPLCRDGEYCSNTPGSFECKKCHEGCTICSSEGLEGCVECSFGYEKADTGCRDVDECSAEVKRCTNKHEVCTNTPGGFTCECDMGYVRTGDKCTKAKGKKKKTRKKRKTKKSKEDQLLEELEKGMYFTPIQLKIGSLLHAVFFAALIGAFKMGSRVALAALAFLYVCCVWYVSRAFRNEKPFED